MGPCTAIFPACFRLTQLPGKTALLVARALLFDAHDTLLKGYRARFVFGCLVL